MVLFVCYSGVFGGAERQLVEVAGALGAALRSECCVACPESPLAQAARGAGMNVFPLRVRSLHLRASPRDRLLSVLRLAGHALEVRALVDNLDPELVIAWGMRSAIACAAAGQGRRGRAPLIFQHNDLLPGPLTAWLVRAASARADLVVAASEAVARDLDPWGCLGTRLEVVHPGIDVNCFDGSIPPAEPPEVLVLGALVGWKRPDLALDAFALVRESRPDARLRLVGAALGQEGAVEERLRERAERLNLAGAVEISGALADPRAALQSATCLLHCAEEEPFGLVVLEALATGRPVVVPDSAGPAEIVDGSSGLLYTPGDARAAAEAVLELLASPERAARMGAHGRARAREHFDRAASHRKYVAIVEPLLRKRRVRGGDDGGLSAAPMNTGGLAIVTVSHNSAHELGALLASVDRHLPGARVLVADSASSDDSVAVARAWPGGAFVLPLAENVGFGRACNRALAEVHEPVTVLLNPDVELLDASLLALAREVSRSELGERLLSPLVLNSDGSRQDSVHPTPTSPAELLRAVVPPALLPGRAGRRLAPWRADGPRRVGWAVGCALVARTDTLRRLGPFDERIFLYGEDLDLGLRAAAQGVETWFWPTARVVHHAAHSAQAAFGGEPFDRLAHARHDVVARRLGVGRARLDDVAQAVTFTSRAALKRLAGRSAARERRQLAALARVRRPGR
jgi:N-acetylglucosaminyl-diphospho-decaprenol L-rhamnosyltransferase